MSAFRFIDHPEALNDLVADWAGAPWIGIDTEFVRERTYYARLCLIQLAGPKGVAVVDRIITDLAVLDVTGQGLKLVELAPGVTREQLQEATGCAING